MKDHFLYLLLLFSFTLIAQPGKDGALTVNIPNQIINHYIPVSANVAAGTNTVTIANTSLFSLCAGDLIMIYQAQGANMDITNTSAYGNILAYNSAGLYEFKYIQSVSGNNITTQTTFTNSYAATGNVQIIKVPQYTTLTINNGASVAANLWKDTVIASAPYRFGGLVVIHASIIINNGTITATGSGFRGGQVNNNTFYQNTLSDYVSANMGYGGEKGESISGFQLDYDTNGGRYCRGAPTNGGGGGTTTNAGGGGGANGNNNNTWSGQGVMIVNATNPLSAWSFDPSYIANGNTLTNSSGGGRGGYAWGDANGNATTQGPGNAVWQGDVRREVGGIGGRPLTNINSETRIYFGGGGGTGHRNNNASPVGSSGGGIVYLITTTGITGNGSIISNGNFAGNSTGCSCDGSPGAGAGGSIVIKTSAIATTQNVNANGGDGGNQLVPSPPAVFYESEGPGGGGGGGFVAISATGVTPLVMGGQNGTTLSNALIGEMTFNGSTQGAMGEIAPVSNSFIIYTPPPFQPGNSFSICAGAAINLTTTAGAAAYNWVGPNSFTSSVQNPVILNSTILMSGTYSITQLFAGCQPPATYTTAVTINLLPSATVGVSISTICSGQTLNFSGNGGGNYLWSGPSGFTSGSQNPVLNSANANNNGTYTLLVTSASGCTASAVSPVITVMPSPTISVNGASVCINQPASLNANSSANSFLWNGPNSFTSSAQTINFSNAALNLSGNYNVLVTSAQGCTNTAVANISVYPIPTPSLSSNSPVCAGSTLNLSGSGGNFYSYNGPNGFSSNLQNPAITNVTNAASGMYTLTVSNFGCSALITLPVSIYGSGNGTLSANKNDLCVPFCSTFYVNTNNASVLSTSIIVNGQLFTGNTINYCISAAGNYTVSSAFKDNDGCVNTSTLLVTGYPAPNAGFEYSPAIPIENIDNVLFTNTSTGPAQTNWNWFFINNDGDTSTNQNTSYLFETAGPYPVAMIVKNQWGCSDTVIKIINVGEEFSFYIPNSFTPNGDGLNDIFEPKGRGIKNYSMQIFDRWGEKLFSSKDFFVGWDGTFKGKKCEVDTYTWRIDLSDPQGKAKTFTGHVNIIE